MTIRYVISSNVNYQAKTLPKLLGSMKNINPFNILVVVGGAPEPDEQIIGGITYLYVTHNSFDYTGIIEIVERDIPSDWWFWLHDTCQCGPRFREIAEGSFDQTKDMTVAKVTSDGRALCCIGMYRHEMLMRHREYFLGLKNLNKAEACHHEGLVYAHDFGSKAAYSDSRLFYPGIADVYRNGIPRLIEYYASLDLYKFKANWVMKTLPDFVTAP